MRLPRHLLENPFFCFLHEEELIAALGNEIGGEEQAEIRRLSAIGLPPVTSREALATMLGVNPGIIWSFVYRTSRHYSKFEIPKGRGVRMIRAPKVGLKIVQKWLGYHLAKQIQPSDHVYGFVPGRSHIQAAAQHRGADWIYSVDIRDFFPTTPAQLVKTALVRAGYAEHQVAMLANLFCFHGFLAQGAPSSPVLSNMVFAEIDADLESLSKQFGLIVTRYADDVVFSGKNAFPEELPLSLEMLFRESPWQLASDKTEYAQLPARLKVHGLLVDGERVRLTKGYRKKIRAFRHLYSKNAIAPEDLDKIRGHLNFAAQVEREN